MAPGFILLLLGPGVSIKDYASNFDTVYISLYKYLGASGGAILCGPKAVIDKMPHLIKIPWW